jgi:hypothetical protein
LVEFEYFIKKGLVKKRAKDIELAKSLFNSAKDRFNFAISLLNQKPKYALENAYEAVIELTDSLLALEGFKSWSHEANIVFLNKFNEFSLQETERLDLSRRKRHSSKYYGISFNLEEVKKEIEFLKIVFEKLTKIIESKL